MAQVTGMHCLFRSIKLHGDPQQTDLHVSQLDLRVYLINHNNSRSYITIQSLGVTDKNHQFYFSPMPSEVVLESQVVAESSLG